MKREPVASTSIASVGYDEASRTLEVEFKNGKVYQYYEVSAALYKQFMGAPSKGQFLNGFIRDVYSYSRVR